MIIEIIEIIKWACLVFLFTNSGPTVYIRETYIKNKDSWYYKMLSCSLCMGFHIYLWGNLIIMNQFDPLTASLVSVVSELLDRRMNS